jgi:hypothetical protein
VQSRRERAAHYRKYAAQFRALAEAEQNDSLREKLMQTVHQYEEQARDLEPNPG